MVWGMPTAEFVMLAFVVIYAVLDVLLHWR